MNETLEAVSACAVAMLAGAVLQTSGISAGRGLVMDWRSVKSGETLQQDADAFDTAQLFVALVGPDAALSVARDEVATEACTSRVSPPLERRPANALNLEIGTPIPRCSFKPPAHWPVEHVGRGRGHVLRWLGSGGSPLVFGTCDRDCPKKRSAS